MIQTRQLIANQRLSGFKYNPCLNRASLSYTTPHLRDLTRSYNYKITIRFDFNSKSINSREMAADSSTFVGKWVYVPDSAGDEGFYQFLKLSELSQCPLGTKVTVEVSVDGDVYTQHDSFEGVNEVQYSFRSGVPDACTLDDGRAQKSVIRVEGNKWVCDKSKGENTYSKTYTFDGDVMKAAYSFAGPTSALSAFATFKKQN